MTESIFQYRGRLPKRSDGKARRQALLEATLEIIVKDGVRGVRHRAVAEQAGVPLAATTYYFDDIFDLIHDTFIYFSEKAMEEVNEFENSVFAQLEEFQSSNTELSIIVSSASLSTIEYFTHSSAKKQLRLLEHTFRTQALRDYRVAEMVKLIERQHLSSIEKFLEQLSIEHSAIRAKIIYAVFQRIEYELTLGVITSEQAFEVIQQTLIQLFNKNT
ncbi:MAG: hypothetical protein HWE27_14890 [Gammaproteobacteria bacterium]|nr:hypothetical protein [Gammaproteobacteria bacterium]